MTQYGFCNEQYDGYTTYFEFSFIPYLIGALRKDSKIDWFYDQITSFNGKYEPKFAEIRTSRGMGFAFNMIDADKMLNLNQ
jgi:hypothetical protein